MLAKIVTGILVPVTIFQLDGDFDFLCHFLDPSMGVFGWHTVAGETKKQGNGTDGTNTLFPNMGSTRLNEQNHEKKSEKNDKPVSFV